jgi:hypothetical protein
VRPAFFGFACLVLGVAAGCGGKNDKEPTTTQNPPTTQGSNMPVGPLPSDKKDPPKEKKDPPVEKKSPRVEIAKNKVSINGTDIPLPCELAPFEKALGKPSGTVDDPVSKSSEYVYWNSLGIIASREKAGKQLVREFDLDFETRYDISSKSRTKPFPGEIVLEGRPVTAATTLTELKAKLPSLETVFGNSLRMAYHEPPIQVLINPAQKGVQNVTVMQPPFDRK